MDYFNDPELNGKYLGTITKDFATASDTIKDASYQIRKREISQYPVFVFARQTVQLGSLLINGDELDLQWHVFASYLEILTQQGIVDPEKIGGFSSATWKNPDEFCCLFVVDEEFTNFVYIPYPED